MDSRGHSFTLYRLSLNTAAIYMSQKSILPLINQLAKLFWVRVINDFADFF